MVSSAAVNLIPKLHPVPDVRHHRRAHRHRRGPLHHVGRARGGGCSAGTWRAGWPTIWPCRRCNQVTLRLCMGGSYAICARMPGAWLGLVPRVLVGLVVPNVLNLAVYGWGREAGLSAQLRRKTGGQTQTKGESGMTKVGMLYICTGKYTVFWPEFYARSTKNSFPTARKSTSYSPTSPRY